MPAITAAAVALAAAPAPAVVGGQDASPGEYPAVAEITFARSCAPAPSSRTWVLSAGHCGSVTGAAVATPASWPAALIDVRIGSNKPGQGERVPVSRVVMQPNYLLGSGYDISLLQLSGASTKAPAKVAGTSEGGLWSSGTLETIVGWGATEEGGDTPDTLQEGEVPITTDAYCDGAYSDFDPATMVCAGFPRAGWTPARATPAARCSDARRAACCASSGPTSFGEGCARPNKPGVYARVGDTVLREWIRGNVPDGVG